MSFFDLGPLNGFHQDVDSAETDQGEDAFEFAEGVLDLDAAFVDGAGEDSRLFLLVGLRRDHRDGTPHDRRAQD